MKGSSLSPVIRPFLLALLGVALPLLLTGAPAFTQPGGVSSFDIRIPQRPGDYGIFRVTAVVSAAAEIDPAAGIALAVTNDHGVTCTLNAVPGGPTDIVVFDPAHPFGAGCTGGTGTADSASLEPPAAGLLAGDPQGFRYTLQLHPESNLDRSVTGICPDVSGSDDTWSVALSAPTPNATSVCLISYDQSTSGAECTLEQEIEAADLTEVASLLLGGTPSTALCGGLRPAADVVLVLDRSGSMDNQTLGSASRPKFSALRDAVDDFVAEWGLLRGAEVSPPDDQIGLVFFNANASTEVPLGGFAANSTAVTSAVQNECGGTDPPNCSGSTSMGDGLEAAVAAFDFANDHRKVILLMSNGKENAPTRVTVDDPTDPSQVLLYETDPNNTTPLLAGNQPVRIYSVTVGTSTAVSADKNEDIAQATGGFYLNSEDDQELLRPFFLELIENALRFNTWETIRYVTGELTGQELQEQIRFPVASTTRALTVNVMWDRNLGTIVARLRPAGYAEQDAMTITGRGAARTVLDLPMDPPATANGDWILELDADPAGAVPRIPFSVVVQGDDRSLHAELRVAPANYVPGDEILLTARLSDAGVPLLDLDGAADTTLVAAVVKPDTPIGDLLAQTDASAAPPSTDDVSTPADSKLANLLSAGDAELPRTALPLVGLVDDGTNGDSVAGDGVYSGVVAAAEPGHYNVVFGIDARSDRSGRFARQRVESIHVRAVPDPQQTKVSSTRVSLGPEAVGTRVTLELTPLTRFGNRMVGFAPYLPVTAGGLGTVIPTDHLDGTYSAILDFPGEPPADIAIHWIETSTDLHGVPAEALPPLGDATVLVADVSADADDVVHPVARWWLLLLILALLLLIVIVFAMRNAGSAP
jgi:hypothetical protein